MSDPRYKKIKGGKYVDYWTFKPGNENVGDQLKQLLFKWDPFLDVRGQNFI